MTKNILAILTKPCYTQSISKSLEESREVKSKERTQPYVTETEARRLTNQEFERRRVYTTLKVFQRAWKARSIAWAANMIGKISGLVDLVESNYLILDVNGVGYLLHCSANTLKQACPGARLSLFVETHVKEDCIMLYGFLQPQDRLCFLELTTVKGIGPRIALHVLGHLTSGQICSAINAKDKKVFSNISGLGPKLIDRMFAELQNRAFINNFQDEKGSASQIVQSAARNDAVDVLVNLGVNRAAAVSMVARILSQNPQSALNDIVKCALSEMSTR